MGKSGADRQREWRERHKGEPTPAKLRAKLAALEAEAMQQAPATRFRLVAELPGFGSGGVDIPADWSEDEDIVSEVITHLDGTTALVGDSVVPTLVCLSDLLERAAPQVIDALRRQVALNEQAAARKAEAKAAKGKRPKRGKAVGQGKRSGWAWPSIWV